MLNFIQTVGPLFYPLAACSIVALALILERVIYLLSTRNKQQLLLQEVQQATEQNNWPQIDNLCQTPNGIMQGIALLWKERKQSKLLREEFAQNWLAEKQNQEQRYIKALFIISVISPLLGLLGTVVGMLSMFANIAELNTIVTPSVIADGLWQAMLTTVIGLSIAIPSLLTAHIFNLWIQARNHYDITKLNQFNLLLELKTTEL